MQVNVLLVDDEPGIIQALRRMLRSQSWQLFEANDGEEALEILRNERIHVMVTDFKMPRRDGISLCQEARRISPYTYRLLLSGQVDYAALREAWHAGDVHRFVAKPWDNTLLTMDIEEGVQQQRLLDRTHQFGQAIATNSAVMLTDDNWVVRLANPKMCDVLGTREEDLLGRNLFSVGVSAEDVTQEAEVTRQTEQGHTWLGHFTLHDQSRQQVPAWMAIAPLGPRYRLCVCDIIGDNARLPDSPVDARPDLKPAPVEALPESAALRLELPITQVQDLTASAALFSQIKALLPADTELYHLPQPNRFLVALRAPAAEQTLADLAPELKHQDILAATMTSIRVAPDKEDYEGWLRDQLGMGSPSSQRLGEGLYLTPVFGLHGDVLAVETPAFSDMNAERWEQWFAALVTTWQSHFTKPLRILVDASQVSKEDSDLYLSALEKARTLIDIECTYIVDEGRLLSDGQDDILWHGELVHHNVKRMINHFGRSFLNARQILSLPIDGISLAPEFMARLQAPKNAAQGGRLLQKLKEHGLTIYARHIKHSELLAVSHKARIDMLSGSALSPEISLSQLQWYAPDTSIG